MHHDLRTPLSVEDIVRLCVGDTLSLSGEIITARDRAHKYLTENVSDELPFSLSGGVLYHCGPIVHGCSFGKMGTDLKSVPIFPVSGMSVIAAGPTTSNRLEPYTASILQKYDIRMIIGKGGMGEKTLSALRNRAVYSAAVGGAAQILAKSIQRISNVYKREEFGAAEAFWIFEVENFPLTITMDAHGRSLHAEVRERSEKVLEGLLKKKE